MPSSIVSAGIIIKLCVCVCDFKVKFALEQASKIPEGE
jgi:hypothetical protein